MVSSVFMKKLFLTCVIIGFVIVIVGFIWMWNSSHSYNDYPGKLVYIKKNGKNFQLVRNGKPFFIKGASGNSHLKELSEIGGNTLRIYDTINIMQVLDEALKYDLAVIVDIPIPKYYRDIDLYSNEKEYAILKLKVKNLVRKHKDHPALLMWNLGNELSYPLVFRNNKFINVFNELIDIIHQEDFNHPVSTALAEIDRMRSLSIYFNSPELDLLCYNTFGGVKDLKRKLRQLSLIAGHKPYFLSEIGSDGAWESRLTSWNSPIEQTSVKKAEQIVSRYNIVMGNNDNAFLGSLVFYWGNKHQVTFSWYSLFVGNYKSEILKSLNNLWKKSNYKLNLMGLDYMLVDSKGAADNIIFSPHESKLAELIFNNEIQDSLKIEWEIYPDAWYEDWNESTFVMARNTKKLENLIIKLEGNRATFNIPEKEGPYRIFAYVYDQNGYFATTNTPFYVLKGK